MMIAKTGTSNNALIFLVFHQSTAQGFDRASVIFVAVEARFALKEPVAVFAKFPLHVVMIVMMVQV
jgi:hypothetical protein